MKKTYTRPELEAITLNTGDIMTLSLSLTAFDAENEDEIAYNQLFPSQQS